MNVNKQIALELAVATFKEVAPEIHRNHGDWVIEIAKQYEGFLTSPCKSDLEIQVALYQSDAERIWALMPELRNTESHYELFEAVEAKIDLLRSIAAD